MIWYVLLILYPFSDAELESGGGRGGRDTSYDASVRHRRAAARRVGVATGPSNSQSVSHALVWSFRKRYISSDASDESHLDNVALSRIARALWLTTT